MKINKKIAYFLSFFESKKRGDDSIVVLKDISPEELRDSVREAHGDRLPDDWIYQTYESILSSLTGYDIESVDDIADNRAEIVDGLVDVYTSNLTEWLNSNPSNVYYMTRAQGEYGPENDGFKLLAMAQYLAIDDVFSSVYDLLTKK